MENEIHVLVNRNFGVLMTNKAYESRSDAIIQANLNVSEVRSLKIMRDLSCAIPAESQTEDFPQI